ncbi:MAG: helix-turn-helix transcriptional regulator, partial [Ruminococcus sp.]|nr:helix-turn-helix transcriptional regulator [Ruminococcus sp.]
MFVRIRNLREDNDLTQREIAEYLFCDQSLYSKYERGLRDVPVEIIIQLAKFYNTSTDYRASLKTPFEKKQLCTSSASSTSLGVRQHAFGRFPCSCHTYLFFFNQT